MVMYKDDSSPYCYFHPKEEYVGVCPLCLNERLLVLASKQRSSRTKYSSSSPVINLPKIFTLSSLLSRLDLRHRRKFHPSSDLDVSTSQEDSFISIKFENDGNASWERKTVSKIRMVHLFSSCGIIQGRRNQSEETGLDGEVREDLDQKKIQEK
ncbi:hypothetical protein Bca101_070519 [Brassica carinata]